VSHNIKKIEVLDGVRGLAILLVMFYHFSIPFQHHIKTNNIDILLAKILQTGWVGVDLFFVMSGFLITSILLQTRVTTSYFKNFYVRRVLRIFPLFYAVLLILIIILPSMFIYMEKSTLVMQENSLWFWTYLVNFKIASIGSFSGFQGGYMWSLAIEEQFYLIWPIIVFCYHKNIARLSMIIIVLSIILRIILMHCYGFSATSVYVLPFTHIEGLLFGACLSVIYKNGSLNKVYSAVFYPALVISLGVLLFVLIEYKRFVFYDYYTAMFGLFSVAILAALLVLKLLLALEQENKVIIVNIFESRVLNKFGGLCYGLYLFHHPIGVIVNKLIPIDTFTFMGSSFPTLFIIIILSSTSSYFVAYYSYLLFEKPFLKLKKYFV